MSVRLAVPEVFSLERYFERIGFAGAARANAEVLEAVQRAQLARIPFENFDILLGRGISVEPAAICAKLLERPRGGYCFELNGLFLMALHAIGFEARPLLARVHLSGEPSGRSHELLLVTLGGRPWIADAGFGGTALRAPIPFELGERRVQDGQHFRLVDAGAFGTMLQSEIEGQWRDLYSFDLAHVCPADIALGNHFTSTHPSSFFTFARVAALHVPDGRLTLFDLTLRRAGPEGESTRELPEGAGYIEAMSEHFGIRLDASYEALRPLRARGDAVA